MAQNRADISFGDLGSGIQIGINNGPIHLPPGTSVTTKPGSGRRLTSTSKFSRNDWLLFNWRKKTRNASKTYASRIRVMTRSASRKLRAAC
jgi:hypothetical protein